MARLADHHDGLGPAARSAPEPAVRIHEVHAEIDVVLACGHSVLTTTAAVRAATAPLLPGRAVHITVTDVEGDPDAPPTTVVFRPRQA